MDDTSTHKRVVFTAATVSAVAYGILVSIFIANGGMVRATGYLAIIGLCIALPLIGLAIRSAFPSAHDYATGVMLSPFPGAITYLLATLWMAIT